MKIAMSLVALLLAGCGTAPPPTQTVYVPVHTPCVTNRPVRPAYEFDKLHLDAPAGEKVISLVRDWLVGRKYEGLLEAALAGCVQKIPQ